MTSIKTKYMYAVWICKIHEFYEKSNNLAGHNDLPDSGEDVDDGDEADEAVREDEVLASAEIEDEDSYIKQKVNIAAKESPIYRVFIKYVFFFKNSRKLATSPSPALGC